MDIEHLPRTCKWASPTLFLNWPLWLDAWSWEWSCYNDGAYKPLMKPQDCRTCPRWEPREEEDRRSDMRRRVLVGTLLIAALAVTTLAAMVPSRKAVAVTFRRPTIVVSALIQGDVVFEHDDDRMARGEPCTTVYQFDAKRKVRGNKIVEFMCTPRGREVASKFEAVCSRGQGAGPDRLVEYQFSGDTEGHGVPYY